MANIKSAQKRILVNEKKKIENIAVKSDLKTAIKKVKTAAAAGNKEEAQKLLSEVFGKLDHAATANVIHKKNAANKKAALAKLVDKMK